MRTEFIPEIEADGVSMAVIMCPWAAAVVEVEGGYMAWESEDDYEMWQKQQ